MVGSDLLPTIASFIFAIPGVLFWYWLVIRARGLWPAKESPQSQALPKEQRCSPWIAWDSTRLLISESGLAFTSISWNSLVSITVQPARDARSLLDPVYWHFNSEETSLRIPEGADGLNKLADYLAGLPGFDVSAARDAKEWRGEGGITVWARTQ